jgi:hypothetical protein
LLFSSLFTATEGKLTRGGGKSEEEDEKVASLFGSLDPYGRIFGLKLLGIFFFFFHFV